MKKNLTKRITAAILVLLMVFSMIPMGIFAENGDPDRGYDIELSEYKDQNIAIKWVDNDINHRPSYDSVKNNIKAYFCIDEGERIEFTPENAAQYLDMTEDDYNAAALVTKKANTGTLDVYEMTLPSVLTEVRMVSQTVSKENEDGEVTEEVVLIRNETKRSLKWIIEENDAEPDVLNYYLPVVKSPESIQVNEDLSYDNVWVYREQCDNFFKIAISQGNSDLITVENAEKDLILYAKNGDDVFSLGSLDDIDTTTAFGYAGADGITTAYVAADEENGSYTLIDLPKYNDEKIEIIYYVKAANSNKKIELENTDDYFSVSYNNDACANFSSNMTQCHSGGTMNLILTGSTDYKATKLWLDNGAASRPDAEFLLWRYTDKTENSNYQQAARSEQVYDKVTVLSGEDDIEYIEFKNLPKYDMEGYPYVYLARENLQDGNYEIVYLTGYDKDVNGDISGISVDNGTSRNNGDKSIYNDGVVANRLNGTVEINWRKDWKASNYQDDLSKVNITFGIRRRMKGSSDPWTVIDTKAQLDGFIAESLYKEGSFVLPKYDELGRELEYEFFEESITENERPVLFDAVTGRFNLQCNNGIPDGDTEYFVSEITDNGSGTQTIVNRLVGSTTYTVDKLWAVLDDGGNPTGRYGKEPPVDDAVAYVQIYQDGTPYGGLVELNRDNNYRYSYNLPKYDSNGKMYEYVAYEKGCSVSGWSSGTAYNVVSDGIVIDCQIKNTPSGKPSKHIWIKKDWKDDGNVLARESVKVNVYRKALAGEDSDKLIGSYVITDSNGWEREINVSEYTDETNSVLIAGLDTAEYYIREVQVGSSSTVNYDFYGTNHVICEPVLFTGSNNSSATVDLITTASQKYEAYYTKGTLNGLPLYTVVNRRVGTIDYEVTKEWVDGNDENGLRPDNVSQFKLVPDNTDGYSGGELTISDDVNGFGQVHVNNVVGNDGNTPVFNGSNMNVSFLQNVSKTEKTYYYRNLPKYDSEGRVLHYDVIEINVDEPYVQEVKDVNYESNGQLISDVVSKTVVNIRKGTKTVVFNKLWKDNYACENGLRPDIYLVLYSKDNETGEYKIVNPYPECTLERTDSYNWSFSFTDVPKFDSKGREIFYYATENSSADMTALEYAPVILEEKVSDGSGGYIFQKMGSADTVDGKKLLPESGRFVNKLTGKVVITGKKVWKNVPEGTPIADLPALKIKVNRTIDDTLSTDMYDEDDLDVGTLTTLDLNSSYNGYECVFTINKTKDLLDLPKYDDDGYLYYYKVQEAVISDDPEHLASTTYTQLPGEVHDFIITNTYASDDSRSKNIGYLTVTKKWSGLTDFTKYNYPAVQFKLYRHYESNDTSLNYDGMTEGKLVETVIIPAGTSTEINKVFSSNKLLMYAPNGKPYNYYIEETILNGYDTTIDSNSTYVTDDFTLVGTSEVSPSNKEFDNSYNPSEKIRITGKKIWEDYTNVLNTRPGSLAIKVIRYADAQKIDRDEEMEDEESQNANLGTAIEKEDLTEGTDYTLVWNKDADTGYWSYEITGLTRYAPNGMPWKYIVEETVPSTNGYTGSTSSVKAKNESAYDAVVSDGSTNSVEMKDLKNTILTTAKLTKTWNNDNNSTNLRPKQISVKLQYRIGETENTWKDATLANIKNDGYMSTLTAVPFKTTYTVDITGDSTTFTSDKDLPGKFGNNTVYWRFIETAIGTDAVTVSGGTAGNESVTYNNCGSYIPSQTWTKANGTAIVNSFNKTKLTVSKVWSDEENKYNTRPNNITVILQKYIKTSTNSAPVEADWITALDADNKQIELKITKDDGWENAFEDLPVYDGSGGTYIYRAVEKKVPDGYYETRTNDKAVADDYTTVITNTLTQSASVKITKCWYDANGNTILNPNQTVNFEIRKVKNNKQISFDEPIIVTLNGTETNPWTTTVTGLPKLAGTTYIAVEVIKNSENKYVDYVPQGFWKSGETGITLTNPGEDTPLYSSTINNTKTYIRLNKLDSNNNAITTDYTVSYDIKSGENVIATWKKTKTGNLYKEELLNVNSLYDLAVVNQPTDGSGNYVSAKITGLPIGSYTLSENSAPQGYEISSAVSFSIESDGKIKIGTEKMSNNLIVLKDNAIDIGLKKTDMSGTKITSDYAEFKITGNFADGATEKNISTSATATNGIDSLKGLWISGNAYVFEETKAPNGYELSDKTVKIKVKTDGTIEVVDGASIGSVGTNNVLCFKNKLIEISLEKYTTIGDADVLLDGAQFTFKDETANKTTTITVSNSGKTLTGNASNVPLIQGHTYSLTEIKAPNGYILPDGTCKISFTMNNDGTMKDIDISSDFTSYVTAVAASDKIKVKNNPIVLTVEKWNNKGEKLTSNEFKFKVTGSFADTSISYVMVYPGDNIEGLIGGNTYTITEETAPLGYKKISSAQFSVGKNGTATTTGNTAVTVDGNILKIINQYVSTGKWTATGSKNLIGRDYLEDEVFKYEILDESDNVVATGESGDDGVIEFTDIVYLLSDVGNYTYTIHEVNEGKSGITYDDTEYTVNVTVTSNGTENPLNVVVDYNGATVVFENTYHASGKWHPTGQKFLNGRDYKTGETFTYSVKENGSEVATGSNSSNGYIDFTDISFDENDVGEHIYTITETPGSAGGVEYDSNVFTVKINVVDNGDGTLSAVEDTQNKRIVFINKYNAEETFTPEGIGQIFTGRDFLEGEKFEFVIMEGSTPVSSGFCDENGMIDFAPISYSPESVGVHTYIVKEVEGDNDGIAYDGKEYVITVTVTDNGDGTLRVSAVYSDEMKFNNTYSAKGSFVPAGIKKLVGRDFDNGEEFHFSVTEGDNEVSTGIARNNGAIEFTPVEYTLDDVGTHTYKIFEINDNNDMMEYDENIYTVAVTVSDNGDGKLLVNAIYAEEIYFENVSLRIDGMTGNNQQDIPAAGAAYPSAVLIMVDVYIIALLAGSRKRKKKI